MTRSSESGRACSGAEGAEQGWPRSPEHSRWSESDDAGFGYRRETVEVTQAGEVSEVLEASVGQGPGGYRGQPLREFRAEHAEEYLEPESRTSPIEPFLDPELTVPYVNQKLDSGEEYQQNCCDCARAYERIWRGDLEEAAGRAPLVDENGEQVVVGEKSERTEEWADERFTWARDMHEVRNRLKAAGHGASAIIHTDYRDIDGSSYGHAFNAVNHEGTVKVVESQHHEVLEWDEGTGHPWLPDVHRTRMIGWDREGRPLWPEG